MPLRERAKAMSFRYNDDMGTFLRHRVAHAWIAMLAILFGMSIPSVSCAMMASAVATGQYMEICTAQGVAMMPVDAGGTGGDAMAKHAGHCAGCSAHATPAALPPAPGFVLAAQSGHDAYPPLFYRSPRPLAAWVAANPRGPPVLVS